jgi:aryl-alcohol dehydrogenase-like predicted oxidoreductase
MSPQLLKRQLGRDGPMVTALGFGGMGLSVFYGKVDSDQERFKILDRAYELGETFWDSADMYGDNEDLIGKWFKRTGKRDDVRETCTCAYGIALRADIQVDLPCHQVC